MRIQEKIFMRDTQLAENGPITIVAFGDSVTHGALGTDEYNYETVYWNRLRQKILKVRNYIPVNVINAGIAGTTAKASVARMDSQVLCHNPDLIIVCFGLNDVGGPLEEYLSALRTIFQKGKDSGADVIFMTPNMMNTYVAEDTDPALRAHAAGSAEIQNSGRMDAYMHAAVALAGEMQVMVCDCYAKWKKLSETEDTTMLLANRINHPIKEMHQLFADSLFEVIFSHSSVAASA